MEAVGEAFAAVCAGGDAGPKLGNPWWSSIEASIISALISTL